MRHLLIGLLVLAILLFWNVQVVTAQFSEAGVEKFRVPVEAPEFTLKELSGGKLSLKDLRGKVVLVNFFAPY
jgi:cytochrome oxidase Cu insertion factor (SCO1/SenC/PrrC family)